MKSHLVLAVAVLASTTASLASPASAQTLPPGQMPPVGVSPPHVSQDTQSELGQVFVDVDLVDFGVLEVGSSSPRRRVVLSNANPFALEIDSIAVDGPDAVEFGVAFQGRKSFVLAPGTSKVLGVTFAPPKKGAFEANVAITYGFGRAKKTVSTVALRGVGIGPAGAETLINLGGPEYLALNAETWSQEYGVNLGGVPSTTADPIEGTFDDVLYHTQHRGVLLDYDLPIPSGAYFVTLHFAEIVYEAPGLRAFDVLFEGERLLTGLDPFALAGHDTAHTETIRTLVVDGVLDISFQAFVGEAEVAAIEVRSAPLVEADLDTLSFGAVSAGTTIDLALTLQNEGVVPAQLTEIALRPGGSGSPADFDVIVGGNTYAGAVGDTVYPAFEPISVGGSLGVTVEYEPTDESLNVWTLELTGNFGTVPITVAGLGGHVGHPFLHVVMDVPAIVVDYDGNGQEDVLCDGFFSHTHEPGHVLVDHEWRVDGVPTANGAVVPVPIPLGSHTVELVITDDNVPAESLGLGTTVEVVPASDVPGAAFFYYEAGAGLAASLLDAIPANADFLEVRDGFDVAPDAQIADSPYTGDVMIRATARITLDTPDTYSFTVVGGADSRLEIDDVPYTGPLALGTGVHQIEVRWAIDGLGDLPLDLQLSQGGLPPTTVSAGAVLTHDESTILPVINGMPALGSSLGGNAIDIEGLGFFPTSTLKVHWGNSVLQGGDLTSVSPDGVQFSSPAGTGSVLVRIETDQGFSNGKVYTYDAGAPVPLIFQNPTNVAMAEPIAGAWAPDGRFFIGKRDGQLVALTLDDAWNVTNTEVFPGVSLDPSGRTTILGIAIDPWEDDSAFSIYVAHQKLFFQDNEEPFSPYPYLAQISRLSGASFSTITPVVTNLPVSNHDHGVNGMVFDNNGDLLFSVGSQTNAGVEQVESGGLPESPLSAAIVKAELSNPSFDGDLSYVETAGGAPNDDQMFGDVVDLAPGTDVWVHASGVRNGFDLVYTTSERLYASDNGPNFGFGPPSTSATTQGFTDPTGLDEVLLIEVDNYYGHPNRNRGRYDDRQNVYRNHTTPSIPGEFTQAIVTLPASMNGIDEYRADAFAGQLRGDLLVQRWISYMRRVELSVDGRSVVNNENIFPWTGALGLRTGPGGTIQAIDQVGNAVKFLVPNDLAATGLTVYDVFPWRAPATGGQRFVIGGHGFGSLADTSVKIGGLDATLTSVTPTRIVGEVPAHGGAPTYLVDVQVTVNGEIDILPNAFRYLLPKGQEPGNWSSETDMLLFLGEVASGVIDGKLYVVGEGAPNTFIYDIENQTWDGTAAFRPFPGHHHGAEVVDGKLYLIGGLGFGSAGKLQIYDPVTDMWTVGKDLPWAGGSVSTALIDGKIYAAGGIVGNTTVDNCAVYNRALDLWTPVAAMPSGKGRNHAASGTDGERFFIFGGRGNGSGDGNWVANGFDDVQIYDPVTDTWEASFDVGSTLAPLPQRRGGMGKAVWWKGEFYVFGGETLSDPGATLNNVFGRVDVYDPATNTWRLEAPMPTPRHGIFPVLYQSRMFLAGGGWKAGFSGTKDLDIFTRQ